jgi:hypothetical protein
MFEDNQDHKFEEYWILNAMVQKVSVKGVSLSRRGSIGKHNYGSVDNQSKVHHNVKNDLPDTNVGLLLGGFSPVNGSHLGK